MERLLGITPGAVTALAAINDKDCAVQFVLDAALAQADIINCHPLRNSATLSIATSDLMRAQAYWQHPPQIISVPTLEPA
jgi:Ala-tRNA(Pro) deacylase